MTHNPSSAQTAAALGHAARGWHVFPLRPGDKRPALRCDWEGRATASDTDRIRACWEHAPYNIGIATGPSGLVVLDLDTPKPGDQPPPQWAEPGINDGADVLAALCERHGQPFPSETYTVQTGRGGLHMYYAAPPGAQLRNTAGRLGWLIDTRACGGYVVAAGSTVNGRPYRVMYDVEPIPLPGWLATLLTEPAAPPARPGRLPAAAGSEHAAGYAGAALRNEVQRVLDTTPGGRNHALNQAAFALGQLAAAALLPAGLVYDCLISAGQQIGLSPRECDTTIRSGLRSASHKPRRGAAA